MATIDRIPLISPVPNDKAFVPKSTSDTPPITELKASPTAADVIAFWEAQAQEMANDLECAVLLHYSALPHFERTGAMLRVDYIPAVDTTTTPEPA